MKKLFVFALSAIILVSFVACEKDSNIPAPEVVNVTLSDLKIESSMMSFQTGKTYEFVVTNRGNINHEFMITPMGGGHQMGMMEISEEGMRPGMMQTRRFTFSEGGEFEFACHLPGHYEGGMKFPITVK